MAGALLIQQDSRGAVTVTLNRPEVHNAFDDRLIGDLTAALKLLADDPSVRVLVLTGMGKSFSAGADVEWMRRVAGYSLDRNREDAAALGEMMARLNEFPRPVIGLINGAAYGGGVGLAACCDIAVASDRASFSLSEVKLGLIPAVISPYVVAAIGARQARRYFLTAEVIDASEALRVGLVHRVVPPEMLHAAGESLVTALLGNGPEALIAAKALVFAVDRPLSEGVVAETVNRIAERRASDEGREGLQAFLEKRDPAWRVPPGETGA